MRFLSLFSGIEAASVAWKPLGWECVAVSEIEPFPCAVLKHHLPDVPNLGDVTKITESDIAALGQIDLVVFGSPCQDLSVAGRRAGFIGERSGLFYTAIDIIRWAREHGGCRFALWENVPGAFSSNQGRDFAAVVEEMAGLRDVAVPANGWGTEGVALGDYGLLEWSVLDAQWFGVAQRRRRVFAIVDFGSWENRRPILLERQSMRGDFAPSREQGQKTTGNVGEGACKSDGWPAEIASTLNASFGSKLGLENQHIDEGAPLFVPAKAYGIPGNWIGSKPENGGNSTQLMREVAPAQTAADKHGVIAFNSNAQADQLKPDPHTSAPLTCSQYSAVVLSDTLTVGANQTYGFIDDICAPMSHTDVRRLTPRECERLQGFPDDWTKISWRGKPADDCPDGHRYKALGNSMAVPVMRWIGQQIDSITKENKE